MLDTSRCQEYFDEVRAKATELGLLDKLQEQLDWLDTYACRDGNGNVDKSKSKCILYSDFAPLSFGFSLLMRHHETGEYRHWISGALIFYGAGDSGVGFDTLSVRVGDCSEVGWQINS